MAMKPGDLTPLSKGGKIERHKGKGSQQAPMPDRGQIKKLPQQPFNSYGKATPMPMGLPPMPKGGGFGGAV
jgi:hypothetical protein